MKIAISILCLTAMIAPAVLAQEMSKKRVYISDSSSWSMRGPSLILGGILGGLGQGGARPQTAEIIKTFSKRCPGVIITSDRERADFTVLLEHHGGKGSIRRDNKFVVYDRNGDVIKSGSTRMLGNAVKDACRAITARND
ncbi:MAG: hypothetical protein IPM66_17700 [Acidobacteriota bacterium]|nr:MAG: hypothetical protein IPM66_17700 [Acidobacteriota bacterium]